MTKILMRLLREPLLHFFAAGAVIFFLYANNDGSGESAPDTIAISAVQIDRLTAQFNAIWRREPTADELVKLVNDYVREEVYYREALALGLDQNDAVVRQRMRQKIEFLSDTGAQLLEPTEAELQAFLKTNEMKYQQGTRLALEQLDLGQMPTPTDIAQKLQELNANPTTTKPISGERSLLPAEIRLSRPDAIDSIYGNGFFAQISEFPVGQWAGPVHSSYGIHLVRILDRRAAQAPGLATMRASVLRDWRAEKAVELRELDYLARKDRFTIEIYGRESQPAEATP